jgi:flagellar hook-length control protein FliK
VSQGGPEKGQAAGPSYAVTSQVHGEVSRLVSRGDGTRRITIKLQPEALGDVRVVLTVRNGEVHVRMAGGELAQQALLQGAPELHRLLEAAGASSSQVVVGDQGSSQYGEHAGRQASGQPQEGAADEGFHQDHRNARMRDGDTSARDGSTGRVHQRPSTDPGTRTPLGVDVTM